MSVRLDLVELRRPPHASAARDDLVVRFRPYVLKLARQVAESVGYHVEIDDLIGCGHMGLMEAAERYDAHRGVAFRTFAHRRIRGAMLDLLRKDAGLANAFVIVDERTPGAAGAIEVICADGGYSQHEEVFRAEVRSSLASALETLTPLERTIVTHHYFNGEPVQRLVRSTRYSKSWLSRVHARALAKMRDRLLDGAIGSEAFL